MRNAWNSPKWDQEHNVLHGTLRAVLSSLRLMDNQFRILGVPTLSAGFWQVLSRCKGSSNLVWSHYKAQRPTCAIIVCFLNYFIHSGMGWHERLVCRSKNMKQDRLSSSIITERSIAEMGWHVDSSFKRWMNKKFNVLQACDTQFLYQDVGRQLRTFFHSNGMCHGNGPKGKKRNMGKRKQRWSAGTPQMEKSPLFPR